MVHARIAVRELPERKHLADNPGSKWADKPPVATPVPRGPQRRKSLPLWDDLDQ